MGRDERQAPLKTPVWEATQRMKLNGNQAPKQNSSPFDSYTVKYNINIVVVRSDTSIRIKKRPLS